MKMSNELFLHILLDEYRHYSHIKREQGIFMRSIYLETNRTRKRICKRLRIRHKTFNKLLSSLMDSKLGIDIHLAGAAPQYYPDYRTKRYRNFGFNYKGKKWAFISFNDEKVKEYRVLNRSV